MFSGEPSDALDDEENERVSGERVRSGGAGGESGASRLRALRWTASIISAHAARSEWSRLRVLPPEWRVSEPTTLLRRG